LYDEREFIARVESASVAELAQILARPTAQQERILRVHYSDERYKRMHELALRQTPAIRGVRGEPSRGNVIVIHGIMGSELSSVSSPTTSTLIWVSLWRLFRGWLERLKLNDDGRTGKYTIRPTGIITDYYGEMLLTLRAHGWNVRPFWFDWRLDLNHAAEELHNKINEWFTKDSPIHIVAHSMGGLVARAFIRRYQERWEKMWDKIGNGRKGSRGGRLVMLGTPSYGSFAVPQIITGLEPMVRKLALLDLPHGLDGVRNIVNTFPGLYQMLPSPFELERMEGLYQERIYGDFNVSQRYLDAARRQHELLRDVVDDERMIYIAGFNRLTLSDLRDLRQVASPGAYDVTLLGDGRVTHQLGIPTKGGGQLKTVYFIDEDHGELPRNEKILSELDGLLVKGEADELATAVPTLRAVETKAEMRQKLIKAQDAEVERFSELVDRLRLTRSPSPPIALSYEERGVREALTSSLTGAQDELIKDRRRKISMKTKRRKPAPKPIRLEVRLVWAGIEEIGVEIASARGGDPAVDAIAVGHYLGIGKPQYAEHEIDKAISKALLNRHRANYEVAERECLLALYSERGIIRGELGQPFFLNDPRATDGRLIVVAGMGLPGRFGAPELTVLARELCWSLGRLKKRHLATVLIGSGHGNLSVEDAVEAWLRGARYALSGSASDEQWRIRRLTFVEADPSKVEGLQKAIKAAQVAERKAVLNSPFEQWLDIDYEDIDLGTLVNRQKQTLEQSISAHERRERRRKQEDNRGSQAPTRITLSLEGRKYRFGAITEEASVPEREIPLDPALVMEANDRLVMRGNDLESVEKQLEFQLDWGRYLENLLIPDDLRDSFKTNAPVVMMLDATTARIHWEMLALPDPFQRAGIPYELASNDNGGKSDQSIESLDARVNAFLSTGRGFTRQLRTGFALPPEPPPPPRRVLRALVVADPAEDAPLPGAEEEGRAVAELFRAFDEAYPLAEYRVDVETLFGPAEATRNDVLFHLTRRGPYDIFHFAGHCVYDEKDPSSSGWIFTGGHRLSANELNRVDHVPKFVFSNACESGITPDRAEARTAALAPGFAEVFFARGVANFVCAAWPVNDQAARDFALRLYSSLLGLKWAQDGGVLSVPDDLGPRPMYMAMREARQFIATTRFGATTWGAYQHYGNPYLQFFDPAHLLASNGARAKPTAQGGQAKGKRNEPRPALRSPRTPPAARRKRGGKKVATGR
jgi:pimeloyl-ACP methyl ester carboxylesterase